MRFHTKPYGWRMDRLESWHRWFAWYPVRLQQREHAGKWEYSTSIVWLEIVSRKKVGVSENGYTYEYRNVE